MDREAWQSTVYRIAKSWTQPSNLTATTRVFVGLEQSPNYVAKFTMMA